MGSKYTSQSASGYNASPPPDDGSTISSNKITWSGIKTKLADAVKNLADAINSQLVTALDVSVSTTSINYTTQASDHQKPILVTGTTTISLGDAVSMGVGYQVTIVNIGTSLVTVTVITGTDTLNGTAGASITLPPYTSGTFETNSAPNGYVMILGKGQNKQAANIASAATLNLDSSAPFGDYAHVTGTTTITAITLQKGSEFRVVFDGALTLTNGASLILPGGANIITTAGDSAVFRGEASGVVRCVSYHKTTGSAVLFDNSVNDFRLTLTSGTPVTTSDVAAATTIYCTPYKGNRIALYDGSNWNIRTSAEFSLALGTLTASLPYDVFCYDNAGTPTLEFIAWTNTTTRATALAYQDGILVKSGAATRRYLGTFYTISTTQTCDSSSAGRYLWNYYHRVPRNMLVNDVTATWTYTTASFRQANGNTANQLNFVIGVSEDEVNAYVQGLASNASSPNINVSIGLDRTNASDATVLEQSIVQGASTTPARAVYTGYPGIGRHYLAWLELSGAAGTTTWYGTTTNIKSGIQGRVMA